MPENQIPQQPMLGEEGRPEWHMPPPPPMEGEFHMPPPPMEGENHMPPPPHHGPFGGDHPPKGFNHHENEGPEFGESKKNDRKGCHKGEGKKNGKNGRGLKERGNHHSEGREEDQMTEDRFERMDRNGKRSERRDNKHRGPPHCAIMKLGLIVFSVWGLINFIFFFKNFRNFKNTTIMIEQFNPNQSLKKKKGKKGKKGKKQAHQREEESKEEVKFERASSSDEENPAPQFVQPIHVVPSQIIPQGVPVQVQQVPQGFVQNGQHVIPITHA